MKQKSLTTYRLSLHNLKKRPVRTIGLIAMVAVLSFVVFGGSILSISLKNGLQNVEARFGADLIAVPMGYDKGMEAILLRGEPSYFYLEREVEEQIAEIEGVKQVTAQFYLATLGQDCCDLPVQLIGIDPETDFSITPWISEVYGGELTDGTLIVGSDIELKEEKKLTFFGKEYKVAAKLEETGTGMDQSVFANMNTLLELFSGAKEKGLAFIDQIDPENSISSVLIKVSDGYDAKTVTHNIRTKIDGLQIIQTQNMISGIADSLRGFTSYLCIFIVMFLILSLVTLTILFSVTANERKKEFAVLRTLGATRKKLAEILLEESFVISTAGGVTGITLAMIILFPFNVYIGDSLGLPYLLPKVGVILSVLLISLVATVIIGPLTSVYAVIKIAGKDTYLTLREGE